jgi:hypothetical protein
VIAVDQFEELFTLSDDEAQRRRFVDALISAWRDPASPSLSSSSLEQTSMAASPTTSSSLGRQSFTTR